MKRSRLNRRSQLCPSTKPLSRESKLDRGKRISKLGRRGKRRQEGLREFRRAVLERADGRCERCGERCVPEALEAHHKLPRSRGGQDTLENGFALCGGPGGCHALVHDHLVPDWRDWLLTR